MRRKTISTMLAVVMAISMVCIPAYAAQPAAGGDPLPTGQTLENPGAYLFSPEGSEKKYSLLDTNEDGEHFVLAADLYGKVPYDSANGWNSVMKPEVESNIAYYLNTTLYNATADEPAGDGYYLDSNMKEKMPEKTWENTYTYSGNQSWTFSGKVSLLSYDEYVEYADKFGYGNNGAASSWWWLRNGSSDGWQAWYINSGSKQYWRANVLHSYDVRPCFWLDRSYFTENKINIASAGSKVLEMLRTVYTEEEMSKVGYTKEQLNNIFPPPAQPIDTVEINGDPRPGRTLTANVTTTTGISGYYSYEWKSSETADGTYVKVSSDTEYVVANSVSGRYVRVEVTSLGEGGNTVTSEPVLIGERLVSGAVGPLPADQSITDPSEYLFYPENSTSAFSLLDTDSEGRQFVLAADSYGKAAFGASKMSSTDEEQVGYYLNTTILDGEGSKVLDSGIKEHLVEYPWLTDNADGDYEWTAKLSLLSYPEYMQYYTKFGYKIKGSDSWWRLRSLNNGNGNPLAVNAGTNTSTFYVDFGSISIRPCFWLDRDYFKSCRIDINSAGSEVLKAIRSTYTREEMEKAGIYNSTDLDKIYAMAEKFTAADVRIIGIPAVGQTLRGIYTYVNDSGAQESGSIYTWYISDGNGYTAVEGETGIEYRVREGDMGKTVKFSVIVRGSDGTLGNEIPSGATAAIAEERALTVNFGKLKDQFGNEVTGIVGQTSLTAEFMAKNNTSADAEAVFALAVYTESNQMIACIPQSIAVLPGEAVYSVSIDGLDIKSGYTVRAMALSDMTDNLNLLCSFEIKG